MKKMLLAGFCVTLWLTVASFEVTDKQFANLQKTLTTINYSVKELEKTIDTQRAVMTSLARQVSQQQLHVEEATRSHGYSGLKITRLTRTGSKSYYSTTFSDQQVAAIHDHSNHINTAGMGELVAVLNGVEFRTRHNDYKLKMPSRNSTVYGATDGIPYPSVPPQVLSKPTLDEQIAELREWFKAWKNSDHSVRDYRKYFKPNLCYLEGQWTNANSKSLDEPFYSERHAIDANNFLDLQAKIRYTSDTGRKSVKENYAYLPSTISDIDEHGNIVYAQWNYRILCHPLKKHVPLTRFKLEEYLPGRLANGKTFEKQWTERSARFSLYDDVRDTSYPSRKDAYVRDSQGRFLDQLMAEIPGLDNYPANLVDNAFGETAYKFDANVASKSKPLNVGYYHNSYKVSGADAMGVSISRRGFSDDYLYVAYNSQPKVALTKVQGKCTRLWKCTPDLNKSTGCKMYDCPEYSHRVSYAIPLEIIYTTPLQTWNPYKFAYHKDWSTPVTKNKANNLNRNGALTKEGAYFGTSKKYYYRTPATFYDKLIGGKADPADTVRRSSIGVLDPSGNVREVMPSGISIMTQDIVGVGPMRLRYPIMPIHDYGSVIHKEVEALTEMTLKKHKFSKLYPDARLDNGTVEEVFLFETKMTTSTPPEIHLHTFQLTLSEINSIKAGKRMKVVTSINAGHNHQLEVDYLERWNIIRIRRCDTKNWKCWDGHSGGVVCTECKLGYPVN